MADEGSQRIWATAISRNETAGRAIVFRYVQAFEPGFDRAAQPDRVVVLWRFDSSTGQPGADLSERMIVFEDLVTSILDEVAFGTLALTSTGENTREWVFYVRDEDQFIERLNEALAQEPEFPIEIHAAPDPEWTTYETFLAGVVAKP